jgi:hypothetical protein
MTPGSQAPTAAAATDPQARNHLVIAHRGGHGLLGDRERPTEPATLIRAVESTILAPLTFSKLLGFENHGSFGRSLIDCPNNPRIAEQLTCSATSCGNSAHGATMCS